MANLSRSRWVVLALESAFVDKISDVLNNHAHEEVGEAKNFKGAKALAEKYLKKARRRARAKKCECGPIGAVIGEKIDAEFSA